MNDDDILLSQRQVKEMRGNCSDMTIYRDIQRGILPAPTKIQKRNFWTLKQVRQAYGLNGEDAA